MFSKLLKEGDAVGIALGTNILKGMIPKFKFLLIFSCVFLCPRKNKCLAVFSRMVAADDDKVEATYGTMKIIPAIESNLVLICMMK